MKMNVSKLVNDQGGKEAFTAKLVSMGQSVCDTAVAVWEHRNAIPDHVLVSLMISDRKLDPRKYGWEPKNRR